MTKQQRLQERIIRHGEALKEFFKLPAETDAGKLSRKLFRLENKGHRLAESICNGEIDISEEEEMDRVRKVLEAARMILKSEKVIANTDPRGHFLKIELSKGENFPVRDWGGNGIIAPDLRD